MTVPAESALRFPHVDVSSGVPQIAGTTMKVVELVMAQRAHGWSPEEIHFQHPDLSMAQIHAALAYYWDHREEIDADIERRGRLAEQARKDMANEPLARRLAALKSGD